MTLTNSSQGLSRRSTVAEEILSPLRPMLALSLETKIILGILGVLCVWAIAIATFGVPALVWPMKLIVPGMVVALVLLTMGLL